MQLQKFSFIFSAQVGFVFFLFLLLHVWVRPPMVCAAGCAGCGPEPSCFHGPELTLVPVVITTLLIRIMTAELEQSI